MPTELEIVDAKDRFAELLDRARSGEEIVLADAGHPVVKLVPIAASQNRPVFGALKGMIEMADDFTAPLPEDELREWEK